MDSARRWPTPTMQDKGTGHATGRFHIRKRAIYGEAHRDPRVCGYVGWIGEKGVRSSEAPNGQLSFEACENGRLATATMAGDKLTRGVWGLYGCIGFECREGTW